MSKKTDSREEKYKVPFCITFQSVRERPYPDEERVKGDPARDLATIHHLCETNVNDLSTVGNSQVRTSSSSSFAQSGFLNILNCLKFVHKSHLGQC